MSFVLHRGGSIRREDGTWIHDPYKRPEQPHHIHLPNGCVDHRVENCPDSHWIGGHPEPEWPHHVENDGGMVGYTRLTQEEIDDLKIYYSFQQEIEAAEQEQARQVEADRQAAVEFLRSAAQDDPALAAIAKLLGL